ncbi:hypothetical protein [Xanthomonas hortorum]|uniref:hypothetical protein n=2 Tax=Xanthomonas hortorum TaxID=56454 RepID=UPI000CEEF4DB|nr:hypothetical protein [Xanthomonas hortorum]MCE4373822.1 hypothetical protein [Xanthomonas hortorum pv. hederae]PPU71000.1 hypothetical protein XhhCFBP4925_23025 [Xanthomonas hortorum pv. hederae]PUE91849.1 hypothetical protein C7T87_23925 [Xanthomonas hortorum pv. hederae]
MRDDKDTRTAELPMPGRPGRPPANGMAAMTDAERSKLYRQRQAKRLVNGRRNLQELTDSLLLDQIRQTIANGSAKRTVARYVTELARRYA